MPERSTHTVASSRAIWDYRLHHGTLPMGSAAVVLGAASPMFLVLLASLLATDVLPLRALR
ncbi:MAG: hypothetical protein WBH47_05245 [Streptosporangiaceae bacterium]